MKIICSELGLLDYALASKLQEILHAKVVQDPSRAYLLMLEHPPTITYGKHAAQSDLKIPLSRLHSEGIKMVATDRGGQMTGHNPGQLVIYPIISLKSSGMGVKSFVQIFVQIAVSTLKEFGIDAHCRSESPGVWIGDRKIASVGFRIAKKTSKHGLAINLNNSLTLFDLFVPCGLSQVKMLNLKQLTGKKVDKLDFAAKFRKHFMSAFHGELSIVPAHELIALVT